MSKNKKINNLLPAIYLNEKKSTGEQKHLHMTALTHFLCKFEDYFSSNRRPLIAHDEIKSFTKHRKVHSTQMQLNVENWEASFGNCMRLIQTARWDVLKGFSIHLKKGALFPSNVALYAFFPILLKVLLNLYCILLSTKHKAITNVEIYVWTKQLLCSSWL